MDWEKVVKIVKQARGTDEGKAPALSNAQRKEAPNKEELDEHTRIFGIRAEEVVYKGECEHKNPTSLDPQSRCGCEAGG